MLKDDILIAASIVTAAKAGIKDYDQALEHVIHMADVLGDGIIAQFPSKGK